MVWGMFSRNVNTNWSTATGYLSFVADHESVLCDLCSTHIPDNTFHKLVVLTCSQNIVSPPTFVLRRVLCLVWLVHKGCVVIISNVVVRRGDDRILPGLVRRAGTWPLMLRLCFRYVILHKSLTSVSASKSIDHSSKAGVSLYSAQLLIFPCEEYQVRRVELITWLRCVWSRTGWGMALALFTFHPSVPGTRRCLVDLR